MRCYVIHITPIYPWGHSAPMGRYAISRILGYLQGHKVLMGPYAICRILGYPKGLEAPMELHAIQRSPSYTQGANRHSQNSIQSIGS